MPEFSAAYSVQGFSACAQASLLKGLFQAGFLRYHPHAYFSLAMATSLSDQEILAALRGMDTRAQERAVEALLGRIKPALIHYVRANSGTREEGVDLANEVVVEIWKKANDPAFQLNEGVQLSTFAHRVGINLWLKELRRRGKLVHDNGTEGSGYEAVDPHTPEDEIMDKENSKEALGQLQTALGAFDKLGADCQQLFRMDAEDRKPEEIMLAMGWKDQDYVRLKRFRCRKAFQKLLSDERISQGVRIQPT